MVLAGTLALVVGCETQNMMSPRKPVATLDEFAKVKTSHASMAVERSVNAKEWSSDRADMSVYPTTQGPVDSYRPIYKVDETHKVSATGLATDFTLNSGLITTFSLSRSLADLSSSRAMRHVRFVV